MTTRRNGGRISSKRKTISRKRIQGKTRNYISKKATGSASGRGCRGGRADMWEKLKTEKLKKWEKQRQIH